MQKIMEASSEIYESIKQTNQKAFGKLVQDIEYLQSQTFLRSDLHSNQLNQEKKNKFEGIDKLEILQSKEFNSKSEQSIEKSQRKRIKQMEQHKRMITQQLRCLNQEITTIKGKKSAEKQFGINDYRKRQKIHEDQSARKKAQNLVKQLKLQKKEIQEKKKKQQQKILKQLQERQEERRKIHLQEIQRIKLERKQAILQRMEEQKKRKQQRKQIEQKSSKIIKRLKKQQKLQKEIQKIPLEMKQAEYQKKLQQFKNSHKSNIFTHQQIHEHVKKHKQIRQKIYKQKQEERLSSLKNQSPEKSPPKYERTIWKSRIQEQQKRRKQQEILIEQRKKQQLSKRLNYGDLIKKVFLPKKNQASNKTVYNNKKIATQYTEKKSEKQYSISNQKIIGGRATNMGDRANVLPKIHSVKNHQTSNSKMYPRGAISRNTNIKMNEFSSCQDQEQKQKQTKIKEMQMRKQTTERLRRLENPPPQRISVDTKKYENYLGKVNIARNQTSLRKIAESKDLTDEQKYYQIMKKASYLEEKAKNQYSSKQAKQASVKIYIDSIQAKLALLEKI